jgi:hypothetical protein
MNAATCIARECLRAKPTLLALSLARSSVNKIANQMNRKLAAFGGLLERGLGALQVILDEN